MAQLIARFSVTGWDELPLDGLDGGWVDAVRMRKSFSSGLVGESVALFVSAGEVEGQRCYFATERITGRTGWGVGQRDGPARRTGVGSRALVRPDRAAVR